MGSMTQRIGLATAGTMALIACAGIFPSLASAQDMTFFVTSVGSGKGADLGGLEGAHGNEVRLTALNR